MKLSKNLFIVCLALIVSCSLPDPFVGDKAIIAKAINTVGNSEILRDVEFEKFELDTIILVADMIRLADSTVEASNDQMLVQTPTLVNITKEALSLSKEMVEGYNRSIRMKIDDASIRRGLAEAERIVEEQTKYLVLYQAQLDSVNRGTWKAKWTAIEHGKINSKKLNDIEYSKSYHVIYIIGNLKTTQRFTMIKDQVYKED